MKTREVDCARPRLRRARRQLGLSVTDMAKRLRVTPGCVSAWELGYRNPTDSLVPDLAKALNMKPGDLLDIIDVAAHPGE